MKRTIRTLFTALIFAASSVNAQNISTIAGNGTASYAGDGGSAMSAELNGPSWIATDGSGNMYISDAGNNCIRKINTSGIISTVAGNGTAGYTGDGSAATSAELNSPLGIAVDGTGNLYIVDYGNNVVRKVNTSGIISTIAGNGAPGYSGDGGAATSAQLYYPQGIALDGSGNIYIADVGNYVIRKVNTSGIISTVAGNNSPGYSGDGGAATSAQLSQKPTSVYVDASGNMFIADQWNNVIRRVNAGGIISTIAGDGTAGFSGDAAAAVSAELNQPHSIYGDSLGNLYITDASNNRIREVYTSGNINTIAGNGTAGFSGDGGPAKSAEINSPVSAIEHYGRLYIADGTNNRIRMTGNLFTGLDEINNISFEMSVYPNPVSDLLTIETKSEKMHETAIVDMLGRQVYDKSYNKQVDIAGLPSGIYILSVIAENGAISRQKFIKQ